MDGHALRAADHSRRLAEWNRVGNAHLADACAQSPELTGGFANGRDDLGVDLVEVVVRGHPDPQPANASIDALEIVGHRSPARRGVGRVPAGHDAQHEGGIPHRARHRAEMVVRPRERHGAGPAHAAVRRLQADDAATRSGQTDRAAGVAAESAQGQSGGDRRARAARRASRAMAAPPGILDVAVMRVVAERPQRQLRHVGLAERDGSLRDESGHRRARHLADEVVAGASPARGRQSGGGAEVFPRHRHAVERPERSAGGKVAVTLLGGAAGTVGVHRDERSHGRIEPVDASQTVVGDLDRRDSPRPERGDQRVDRPVSHRRVLLPRARSRSLPARRPGPDHGTGAR